MTNDLSMGETTINTPAEDTLDAKTFNIEAWVNGIQPTRRGTTIYSRCDLLADLDLLHEQANAEKTAGNHVKVTELRAKAAKIVEELNSTAVDIVVEAWSLERIKAFQEEAKNAGMSTEEAALAQVAAQIVEPAGFTREHLATVFEVSPTQANQIVGIVSQANNAVPVVSVPF